MEAFLRLFSFVCLLARNKEIGVLEKEPAIEIQYVPTTVTVETHTMGSSLYEYLRIKVHPDITSRDWSKIIIRGHHSRSFPSRVMPIEKQIQCFPGDDYVQHFASIVSTYLLLHGRDSSIVSYILPTPAQKIDPLINSNLKNLGALDVAILGYVQGLSQFTNKDWEGGGTSDNEIFRWLKQTLPNGSHVAFIGCRVSFWGGIAGNVVRALQILCGMKCVLYIGKLRSLHGEDTPNTKNVLQRALEAEGHEQQPADSRGRGVVQYGIHYTLSSVLQETKVWLKEQQGQFDWVDLEIGHMDIASLEGQIQFCYLHIVSDNLATKYVHDLLNEREQQVLQDRKQIVEPIQNVLRRFLEEYDLERRGR
ncbi:uncharacterized protein BP5553_02959 [Venustampulla echinocandica]|uniref:Uncharacterized protein n=1 Tax=Venustampulla echinocandica TaxID=2656787 RepID=A0A370TSW1_9HELO|nr:uncharacterized protein BP5553_02959 [Venustampulla echinocandica]RDL38619.1 hypothetical protein BP5553_02959 [Venustampulla echinocandica]